MSLWYEAPNSHKNCWYWSGLAIGLMQSTDLNKMQDSGEIKKWRRLWWSAFVRDRLIALGMKLPIRFRIEDYSTTLISGTKGVKKGVKGCPKRLLLHRVDHVTVSRFFLACAVKCQGISTVVARESDSIGFTLIFWPFGRGYEPRLGKKSSHQK
jgi:hypothetical protein